MMQFWSLQGLVSYEEASQLQSELLESRASNEIPDTVLFLEHAPVITRGRGLQFTGVPKERHMPLLSPLPEDMSFAESERGGDLTYHGPGQLVIYPIVKMGESVFAPKRDIGGYLRKLEEVLIAVLAETGLAAGVREQATGVWVGEKKIASIGIAVRKWVTYHGMALNVVNDLRPFHLISPCGFAPEVMVNLEQCLGAGGGAVVLRGSWRAEMERKLVYGFQRASGSALEVEVSSLSLGEAWQRISSGASSGSFTLKSIHLPFMSF